MEKQQVRVNGVELAYARAGVGAQNLLFIHGNSLSADTFEWQMGSEQLCKSLNMYALDMAGYGDSSYAKDPASTYSVKTQAELVVAFCTRLNLTRLLVVGHSLGGNIAIEVAKQLEDTRMLVLIGAPPAEKPMSQDAFLPHPAVPLFFTPDLTEQQMEQLAKAIVAPGADHSAFFTSLFKKSDPLTRLTIKQSIGRGDYDDQLEALQSMTMPIAMVVGNSDQLINTDHLRQLNLGLWQNGVQMITGGHTPFYEAPQGFNELLLSMVTIL